jgi:hypothetical protein
MKKTKELNPIPKFHPNTYANEFVKRVGLNKAFIITKRYFELQDEENTKSHRIWKQIHHIVKKQLELERNRK